MAFKGLKIMLSVIALTSPRSLAAPSTIFAPALVPTSDPQEDTQNGPEPAEATVTSMNGRKTEMYHNGHHDHKPQHHPHQALTTLIHLLLTIGSAFAPIIGAIVGPLLTNIANGITWAITHTIASGFSPPHGLFSPEPDHTTDHTHNEHPTSYAAQGQPEAGSDALAEQQPVDAAAAVAEHTEPGSVDDTRNGQANKLKT